MRFNLTRCLMLKEFSIKNFTSFNDEVMFSMEADTERVSEHPNHIENINDQKILKVASMYGPNGGGKSNVLLALRLAKIIQQNSGYLSFYEFPCIFTGSDQIDETIFFVDEKYEIGYRFSVAPSETENNEQLEEQLNSINNVFQRKLYDILYEEVTFRKKDETEYRFLFSRSQTGIVKSDLISGETSNQNLNLAKGKTVIRYIYDTFANTDSELSEGLDVIKHLMHQINKIIALDIYNVGFVGGNKGIKQLIKKHENTLVNLLNKIDINIKGIKVYDRRLESVYFVHEISSNGNSIEKELPFVMESDGTKKIFWLLLSIVENLSKSNIFYCNDMNAFLHPKLNRAIIELFQENKNASQLIFNSHDIINMDHFLFRRDEIWFVYRDEKLSSQLIPLSNIENYKGEQVRKDARFGKQYLEGKYGADPFIKRGLNWDE